MAAAAFASGCVPAAVGVAVFAGGGLGSADHQSKYASAPLRRPFRGGIAITKTVFFHLKIIKIKEKMTVVVVKCVICYCVKNKVNNREITV